MMRVARCFALLWSAALGTDAPNFLFLLGDDIGWGDLSYNGGTANTPRIAELHSRPQMRRRRLDSRQNARAGNWARRQ